MMAEHRSYLPSIGIFVMSVAFIDIWRTHSQQGNRSQILKPAVVAISVALAVLGLASATTFRNYVWRSNESLWEDAVAKSPGKYRTWGNLGTAYSENGKETKAINCYRQAIKIEPEYIPGLLNLSNSCLRLNQPKEALDATNQLLNLKPDAATNPPVALGLGLGLMGVGRLNEAAFTFRKILDADPSNVQACKALGMVYGQLGLLQQALEQYQIAYRLQPNDQFLPSMISAVQGALAINPETTKSSNPLALPFRLSSD
jgi:tetratricopeptide (TPR) repeat protein